MKEKIFTIFSICLIESYLISRINNVIKPSIFNIGFYKILLETTIFLLIMLLIFVIKELRRLDSIIWNKGICKCGNKWSEHNVIDSWCKVYNCKFCGNIICITYVKLIKETI